MTASVQPDAITEAVSVPLHRVPDAVDGQPQLPVSVDHANAQIAAPARDERTPRLDGRELNTVAADLAEQQPVERVLQTDETGDLLGSDDHERAHGAIMPRGDESDRTPGPYTPEATLDAAVVERIAEQAHALIDAEHHADLCSCLLWPTDCRTYPGANVLFSTNADDVVRVAAPLFAAHLAEEVAQARADERQQCARNLRGSAALLQIAADDALRATTGTSGGAEYIATWDRHRVRYLAMVETLTEHAAAIARAGTSGGAAA